MIPPLLRIAGADEGAYLVDGAAGGGSYHSGKHGRPRAPSIGAWGPGREPYMYRAFALDNVHVSLWR